MREPRRDHYIHPTTGPDTTTVLNDAIAALATIRNLPWHGDAGATLHLLISLIHQAEQQLPHAVADARDQNYTWAQIADLTGTTRASAWQRYATHTTNNPTPPNRPTLNPPHR